jgi:hypothetical protein
MGWYHQALMCMLIANGKGLRYGTSICSNREYLFGIGLWLDNQGIVARFLVGARGVFVLSMPLWHVHGQFHFTLAVFGCKVRTQSPDHLGY